MNKAAVFCLLFVATPLTNAEFKADVDATTISTADTLRLTLRADSTNPVGSPSIDALRADFDVLNSQTSSQFRSINGQVDAWTTWTFLLKPKHSGALRIPALTLGNEQSKPIPITVRELDPQLRHAIGETVFFETTRTPDRVYVQSQIVVARKLFYANGVQLYGEMPEIPEIPGALVRPLGEPEHSTATRDGHQYGLIEQRFAVFPERSGELVIPQARVSGSVRLPIEAGMGGRRIGIDVSSEPLPIQVLPIPAEYPHDAPWLPATQVELLEDWPGEPQNGLDVGAASQRTLIARVDGNSASAIPPLATSLPTELKAYPETARLNEVPTAAGVVGTRAETTSLVATQPGEATLPEVRLTWWDTVNQEVKTASVPAHTVTITGTAPIAPRERADETTQAPVDQPPPQPTAPIIAATTTPSSEPRFDVWRVGAATLVLIGCAVTVWWFRHRGLKLRTIDPKKVEGSAYKTFVRACAKDDPKLIRTALDAWLVVYFRLPIPAATAQFMQDSNARAAVHALNARLYQSNRDIAFDAAALRACVDTQRGRRVRERRADELPALYPSV